MNALHCALLEPPTTTTWIFSGWKTGSMSSGAALAYVANGSTPRSASSRTKFLDVYCSQ